MLAGLSVRPTPAACRICTASPILLHRAWFLCFEWYHHCCAMRTVLSRPRLCSNHHPTWAHFSYMYRSGKAITWVICKTYNEINILRPGEAFFSVVTTRYKLHSIARRVSSVGATQQRLNYHGRGVNKPHSVDISLLSFGMAHMRVANKKSLVLLSDVCIFLKFINANQLCKPMIIV